jgi:hypothetical protein
MVFCCIRRSLGLLSNDTITSRKPLLTADLGSLGLLSNDTIGSREPLLTADLGEPHWPSCWLVKYLGASC